VGAHDLGGAVRAGVQRDEKARAGIRAAGPVGPQRASDAVLFVVRRDDDVQSQGDLPLRGLGVNVRGDGV
jgi:hypothetical protein